MAGDGWTVTVQGPRGVKHVEVRGDQLEAQVGRSTDPYVSAAWLAFCHLYNEAAKPGVCACGYVGLDLEGHRERRNLGDCG